VLSGRNQKARKQERVLGGDKREGSAPINENDSH
jgi:hypothetical protein